MDIRDIVKAEEDKGKLSGSLSRIIEVGYYDLNKVHDDTSWGIFLKLTKKEFNKVIKHSGFAADIVRNSKQGVIGTRVYIENYLPKDYDTFLKKMSLYSLSDTKDEVQLTQEFDSLIKRKSNLIKEYKEFHKKILQMDKIVKKFI